MDDGHEIRQIHIKLGPHLHRALKLEATISNTSMQDLVVELIRQRIEKSQFSDMLKNER